MTDQINTSADEFDEDPDAPVASSKFTGTLTASVHIDIASGKIAPSFGAETDARILASATKYAEKAGNYTHSLWYLEATGNSVVLSDGQPFRRSVMLKLKSKDGDKLGANQAHAKLAALYRELGVSASYARTTEPDTGIGRMFDFETREIDLGRNFKKSVDLYPVQVYDEGHVYDGEVRTITVRDKEGDGAPANVPTMAPEDVISTLVEILDGGTPEQMMDRIIDDGRLKTVASVFGVPLLDSATDESLTAVLVENGVMQVVDGRMRSTSPVAA